MCVMCTIIHDSNKRLQVGKSSIRRINISTFFFSFLMAETRKSINKSSNQNQLISQAIKINWVNTSVHLLSILDGQNKYSITHSINQWINQPFNQSISCINIFIFFTVLTAESNQATSQSLNQPITQTINQSVNQSSDYNLFLLLFLTEKRGEQVFTCMSL